MNDAEGAAVASDTSQGSARAVADAETLRALADPLRLRILAAIMRRDHGSLRVMSVKEIAADLGEPQTKLYRHVKHLESAGLIKAVSSRVVSGIVEQRYQACQRDIEIGPKSHERGEVSNEAEAAATAALELFRSQFFAEHRGVTASALDAPEREPHRETMLCISVNRITRARAVEIRERLRQVVNDLTEAEEQADADGADTVTVNILLGYFSPDDQSRGNNASHA